MPVKYPKPNLFFDIVFVIFSAIFVGGLYVDGWAHNHLDSALETFFTPWHAIFYGGFGLLGIALLIYAIIGRRRGYSWLRSVPKEYVLSIVGVIIFGLGGALDMAWHLIFGIESNVDALLSPTHLLLAIGLGFIVTAPIRALWYSREKANVSHKILAVIALAVLMSVIAFMTQYVSLSSRPWPLLSQKTARIFYSEALSVGSLLIQTGILMGGLLILLKKIRLPFGSFTILFSLPAFGLSFMHDFYYFVIGAIVSGLVMDIIYSISTHWPWSVRRFRLTAFLAPAIFYKGFFLIVMLTEGTWMSIHLWTGSIVIAGIVGWLMSYLAVPPRSDKV
ncbi:MAG: hypothetical protein G01um10143_666 [Parcubacteria group bacterium Gr01-1014_3]|nr:MAG: hypothetical protein G01um10143_666 [Parcubacteria group bacterium Gr01-1014_3]